MHLQSNQSSVPMVLIRTGSTQMVQKCEGVMRDLLGGLKDTKIVRATSQPLRTVKNCVFELNSRSFLDFGQLYCQKIGLRSLQNVTFILCYQVLKSMLEIDIFWCDDNCGIS